MDSLDRLGVYACLQTCGLYLFVCLSPCVWPKCEPNVCARLLTWTGVSGPLACVWLMVAFCLRTGSCNQLPRCLFWASWVTPRLPYFWYTHYSTHAKWTRQDIQCVCESMPGIHSDDSWVLIFSFTGYMTNGVGRSQRHRGEEVGGGAVVLRSTRGTTVSKKSPKNPPALKLLLL